jgi:hypothetical protein
MLAGPGRVRSLAVSDIDRIMHSSDGNGLGGGLSDEEDREAMSEHLAVRRADQVHRPLTVSGRRWAITSGMKGHHDHDH